MKQLILAALKAKYPAINLSKKRLDAIAAKIESKVIDDETKIDAALETFNEYNSLTEMAAHDDRLRNAEKKLKETTPAPKDSKEEKETEATAPEEVPGWAKTLLDTVQQLKAEKAQTTIQSQLTEKLKGANQLVDWKEWRQPETDEEVTAFVEKVTAKSKELEKTLTEKGFQNLVAPKTAAAATTGKGISEALKANLEKDKVTVNNPATNGFVINTPNSI